MPTLLQVDSSPLEGNSISRQLTREFAEQWQRANSNGKVVRRDLTRSSIPTVNAAWVAAQYTPAESRTDSQKDMLRLSVEFGRELLDADEYVIGVPVHNWGPCAIFKLWVDQFVTPFGPKLSGKRATFIVTAGRSYGPGSGNESKKHVEPWLRTLFGGLGVTDLRVLFADGTVKTQYGSLDRTEFLAPHIRAIERFVAEIPALQAGQSAA